MKKPAPAKPKGIAQTAKRAKATSKKLSSAGAPPKHRPRISKHLRFRIWQAIEYMVSGGAYFWVGYLIFFVADKGLGLNLFWAKLIANIIGWTVNYLLQRYWVFRNPHLKGHMADTSGRYMVITLVDFGMDYLIVASLKHFGISPYIGQFISSFFFTLWNYLWYRFWVFPERYTKKNKVKRPRARR